MRRPSGLTATELTPSWCPVSSWSRCPVSRSQTATVLSSDPETMCRPSGLTATELTAPWCPVELVEPCAGLEVPDRHGLVVGAGDDASAVGAHRHGTHPTLVAGEPAESGAGLEVPDRHGVVAEPETMRRPSGLTATDLTASWCPVSAWSRAPVSRSQTATVLSSDPETMRRPSGLTATELTAS